MKIKNSMSKVLCGVLVSGVLLSSSSFASASVLGKKGKNPAKPNFKASIKKDFTHRNIQKQNKEAISVRLKANLSALVDKGSLTQDKADKVLAALNSAKENRKADLEKMKNMTKEQRKEYIKNNFQNKKDTISQLVDNGTLTEDEAKAINSSFKDMKKHAKALR